MAFPSLPHLSERFYKKHTVRISAFYPVSGVLYRFSQIKSGFQTIAESLG